MLTKTPEYFVIFRTLVLELFLDVFRFKMHFAFKDKYLASSLKSKHSAGYIEIIYSRRMSLYHENPQYRFSFFGNLIFVVLLSVRV